MNIQIGQPLKFYERGEDEWPEVWRLPEADGEGDLFRKICHLTDDLVLRTAVNVFDNCLRAPQAFEGVLGGLLSAHARLAAGAGMKADLEKAADAVRDAWLAMARQALEVQRDGWPQ